MSKRSLLAVAVAVLIAITACSPNTTAVPAQPTSIPTLPPPVQPTQAQPATAQPAEPTAAPPESSGAVFVTFDKAAGTLRSYNLDGSLRFESPAPELTFFTGSYISVFKDAVYYATSEGADKALYRASADGAQPLGISIGKLTAFQVSPDQKWIAWSVLNMETEPFLSTLWIKDLTSGAKDAQQIASISLPMGQALSLVPLRWSDDGSQLYFERAHVGMGGYVLYGGGFSLYGYDRASAEITTYVAAEDDRRGCLDTFRVDLNKVVFNCGTPLQQISILDLQTKQEITLPALPEQRAAGSSAFSPSGQWLAYATARSSQDDEAGQVAVVPADLSAGPQVIFKVGQKRFPKVQGWLDDDTLLVTITNFNTPDSTILTIRRDGTDAREITSGQFVGWAK